jgi:peptidoglycan/LPS O-acetylase OafA/YrhL
MEPARALGSLRYGLSGVFLLNRILVSEFWAERHMGALQADGTHSDGILASARRLQFRNRGTSTFPPPQGGIRRSELKYSAPLDGIRAIAILAVFVFHVFPGCLRGGFTGVDVFFVLSGFLLTSIILQDIRGGSFSLREFYLRRIQRLLPNIVVTVLAVLVLSSLFLVPSSSRLVGRHSLWTVTNLSNFFIWRNFGGYWGDTAGSAPLLHTWSLAVEEQFYLIFPTSMVLLARFQRNRVTRWLLVATALSLGLCLYATPRHSAASFYMLPTRVWELLLGAALASYRTPLPNDIARPLSPSPMLQEATGWVGLSLVLVGFFAIDEAGGFPRAIALLPTIGTTLILISVTGRTRVSRFLSTPFMVGTGKLSYSLYLWHWPLITLGKAVAELRGLPPLAGAAAGAVAGVALAWAAYLFVEQPLRSRGPGRRRRLAIIAAGFLLAVLASGWVANAPKVDIARYFDQPEFHGLLYSVGKVGDVSQAIRYQDVRFPAPDGRDDQAWRSGGVVHQFGDGPPKVVVLGSSHALMYSRLIDSICQRLGLSVAFLGMDGVPAFFKATFTPSPLTTGEAAEFDEARRHWLRTWRPQAVFVIDRWDLLVDNGGRFDDELRSFLREVSPLTKTVLFVAQVPVTATGGDAVNPRELAAWRMRHNNSVPRILPDSNEPKRRRAVATAEAAMAEFPNLYVLRPDLAFYEDDGSIRWVSGRTVYYADDDHLADAGAEVVRGVFKNAIAEATSTVSALRPPAANGRSN